MPVFPVQIINNTTPAVSVTVANSGVPAVTYQQVKQSLGAHVYRILELYLYSLNMNQLLGVIQYQIFDSNGNQKYSSIATTIDPFSGNSVATTIDLRRYEQAFILNGNSSFQTTILPNTYVQVKFWAQRITNEFGRNLNVQIEKDANKPDFFNNYGFYYDQIIEANRKIEKTATLEDQKSVQTEEPEQQAIIKEANEQLLLVGISALAIGAYFLIAD